MVMVEGHRIAATSQLCALDKLLNLSKPQSSPPYDEKSICRRRGPGMLSFLAALVMAA